METRSSPSVAELRRLGDFVAAGGCAEAASLEKMSKEAAFTYLKSTYDYGRLKRRQKRSLIVHEAAARISKNASSNTGPWKQRKRPRKCPHSSNAKSISASTKHQRKGEARADEEFSPTHNSIANIKNPNRSCSLKSGSIKQKLDPIMLVELGDHVFSYRRPNGTSICYNADTLVDYILATGDFLEPESRIPFADADLRELDDIVKRAGINRPSVHEAKRGDDAQKFREQRIARDALVGVERLAGEVVAEIMSVIEAVALPPDVDDDAEDLPSEMNWQGVDPEEAQLRLIMDLFPNFVEHYEQLKRADEEYALQCIRSYKSFILGPPNARTRNRFGFRSIVLDFLQKCEQGIHRRGSF